MEKLKLNQFQFSTPKTKKLEQKFHADQTGIELFAGNRGVVVSITQHINETLHHVSSTFTFLTGSTYTILFPAVLAVHAPPQRVPDFKPVIFIAIITVSKYPVLFVQKIISSRAIGAATGIHNLRRSSDSISLCFSYPSPPPPIYSWLLSPHGHSNIPYHVCQKPILHVSLSNNGIAILHRTTVKTVCISSQTMSLPLLATSTQRTFKHHYYISCMESRRWYYTFALQPSAVLYVLILTLRSYLFRKLFHSCCVGNITIYTAAEFLW